MQDILVVSDVHLRSFWRKVLNTNLPVIFLGDYLDPYGEEITYENNINEFQDIIQYAKERQGDVTLLLGDHECHYIGLSNDHARFDFKHGWDIHKLLYDNKNLFKGAFIYNNALFTHAGVCKDWLEQHFIEENPKNVCDFINLEIVFSEQFEIPPFYLLGDSNQPIGDIGKARGGYAPIGGPIWADMYEIYNNSAFKDQIVQIFAHNQLKETGSIIHRDNWYMCDSRAVFIWNGNELKVYD